MTAQHAPLLRGALENQAKGVVRVPGAVQSSEKSLEAVPGTRMKPKRGIQRDSKSSGRAVDCEKQGKKN